MENRRPRGQRPLADALPADAVAPLWWLSPTTESSARWHSSATERRTTSDQWPSRIRSKRLDGEVGGHSTSGRKRNRRLAFQIRG